MGNFLTSPDKKQKCHSLFLDFVESEEFNGYIQDAKTYDFELTYETIGHTTTAPRYRILFLDKKGRLNEPMTLEIKRHIKEKQLTHMRAFIQKKLKFLFNFFANKK